MSDFLNFGGKLIKGSLITGAIVGKNIADSLTEDRIISSLRVGIKSDLKDLSKLVQDKKDKLHKNTYFDTRSKIKSFEAKITRIENPKELEQIKKEIKDLYDKIKKS